MRHDFSSYDSVIDGSELDDSTIDCYLAMACQMGNGYFELDDTSVEREGSPK